MGVLQHLHIANSLFKYSLILPLPFGVISGAHYTGLNINTVVWCGVNLEFAREIQEKGWVREITQRGLSEYKVSARMNLRATIRRSAGWQ
jgi:hypothetical protein